MYIPTVIFDILETVFQKNGYSYGEDLREEEVYAEIWELRDRNHGQIRRVGHVV